MPITANGRSCLKGTIAEPETGQWYGRIEVDDETGAAFASGAVVISTGAVSWVGTVTQGSVVQGRYVAEVFAGQNGLNTILDSKGYYQTTLAVVAADILTECGEVIDPTSLANLTELVPHWVRAKGEGRLALQAVADHIGGFWRVTREGLVSILTADTYIPIADDPVEEDRDPSKSTIALAPDEHPYARPGTSVGTDRIVTALTTWGASSLRQVVQYHDGTDAAQDQATMLAELARRANENTLTYSRWYPCKVIAQDADGSLQLYPEDEKVRGNGLTKVPLLLGIPGFSVTVAPGSRVRLFFENADPSKPVCALWDGGETVTDVSVGGLLAGPVALAAKVDLELAKLAVAITALGGSYAPGSGPTPPGPVLTVTGTTVFKAT